jgi:hypothetical protein
MYCVSLLTLYEILPSPISPSLLAMLRSIITILHSNTPNSSYYIELMRMMKCSELMDTNNSMMLMSMMITRYWCLYGRESYLIKSMVMDCV